VLTVRTYQPLQAGRQPYLAVWTIHDKEGMVCDVNKSSVLDEPTVIKPALFLRERERERERECDTWQKAIG